jgi:hypothetical protein
MSGEERRPMKKAREKLRVAREERKMPRRRSEKDLRSWYCCGVRCMNVSVIAERRIGRAAFAAANRPKVGLRI